MLSLKGFNLFKIFGNLKNKTRVQSLALTVVLGLVDN